MNKLGLYRLKCNIRFRKFLLNLMLVATAPTNRLAVKLSQNIDKHIVIYQKELLIKYSPKSVDVISYKEEVNSSGH